MITAHQAETIAILTDGGFWHLDCFTANYPEWKQELRELRESDEVKERAHPTQGGWVVPRDEDLLIELGYTPLSRYSIHEQESYELESDMEYLLSDDWDERVIMADLAEEALTEIARYGVKDGLRELAYRYSEELGVGIVRCDGCEERID